MPQPDQPQDDEQWQQLERLVGVERGERRGGAREGSSDPRWLVRPGEESSHGQRPEHRDEDVAHAVAADADHPKRASRPRSRHQSGSLAESAPKRPDGQDARHANSGRGSTQRKGGFASEAEHACHEVSEQRLTPTAIGEEDRVEPRVGQDPMRRERLDGLVGVEATRVICEIPEAQNRRGDQDATEGEDDEPAVTHWRMKEAGRDG